MDTDYTFVVRPWLRDYKHFYDKELKDVWEKDLKLPAIRSLESFCK